MENLKEMWVMEIWGKFKKCVLRVPLQFMVMHFRIIWFKSNG